MRTPAVRLEPDWQSSDPPPALTGDAVHLWRVPLTAARYPWPRETGGSCLSPDELARAARFRSEPAREQFVLARTALRQLLARYTDTTPAAVRFRYGRYGKPALAEAPGSADVRFNIAHAGAMALAAFATGRDVGVDVEAARECEDLLDIAKRMFPAEEYRRLAGLREPEQSVALLESWTQMEALAKAHGGGIAHMENASGPMDAAPVGAGGALEMERPPHIFTLEAAPAYVGSLAVFGPAPAIRCLQWPVPDGCGP